MGRLYLTTDILDTIASIRQKPIDHALGVYLLEMFKKGGGLEQLRKKQDAEYAHCPFADTDRCTCGFCAPYHDGPLLDEVLAEICSFERGEFIFDEKGEKAIVLPENMPF